MSLPAKRTALALHLYHRDAPWEGLRFEQLDVPPLEPGQCLVALLHAPIHPSDINVMQGVYYTLPATLPSVIGGEGCGRVIALGPDVVGFEVGDLVIASAWGGTYTQYAAVAADRLRRVPPEVPPTVACMLAVNPPTAWAMLHDQVALAAGDWVIQNAANSAVGLAVVEVARAMGLRVISVVRRPEAAVAVEAVGGEHVLVEDDPELVPKVKALLGAAPLRLALNAVGGPSALLLTRCLSAGGTLVTYGAMSMQPIPVPGGQLIFKDLRIVGFHLKRWEQRQKPETISKMWENLFQLAAAGHFAVAVEREYPLEDFADAVRHALEPRRSGSQGDWAGSQASGGHTLHPG
eukprot:EG_transcript_11626